MTLANPPVSGSNLSSSDASSDAEDAQDTRGISSRISPQPTPAVVRDTSLDIDVLRALLRLARRRTPPSLEQLVVRVGADERAVRRSLIALARSGLVQRTPAGLRLSLAGLAVAVAYAKRPILRTAAKASPDAVPTPRRQKAA